MVSVALQLFIPGRMQLLATQPCQCLPGSFENPSRIHEQRRCARAGSYLCQPFTTLFGQHDSPTCSKRIQQWKLTSVLQEEA
eukprot:1063951-Pelagomonas_calceolata.AAC.6